MKKTNTAARLNEIMRERNLRQIDILNAAAPYCKQYNIKLGKNDLSQYVNGKAEPGQRKLSILGLALSVSPVWLMGYDVPMEPEVRDSNLNAGEHKTPTEIKLSEGEKALLDLFRRVPAESQQMVYEMIRTAVNNLK